jgi:CRP/FNR family transcriptional regulator
MHKKTIDINSAVRKAAPYLSEEHVDMFLDICDYRELRNKEIIFKAGTSSRMAGFILEGILRGYYVDTDGSEINSILRVENTFIGVTDWLEESKPTKYNFESILESKVLLFDHRDMEALALKGPDLLKFCLSGYKEALKTLLGRIESAIGKNPEERYKELLNKNPLFISKAFNKHIANYLGITPVSLSRIVKRIKESND